MTKEKQGWGAAKSLQCSATGHPLSLIYVAWLQLFQMKTLIAPYNWIREKSDNNNVSNDFGELDILALIKQRVQILRTYILSIFRVNIKLTFGNLIR